MDMTPGRAAFTEDEYKPLRPPRSLGGSTPSTPTHGATYSVSGDASAGDGKERTMSPTKLSPYAKEFVPRLPAEQSTNEQQYHQQQRQYHHANGYAQNEQQQPQQPFSTQVASLGSSVQDRLKIAATGAGYSSSSNSSVINTSNKSPSNNFYQRNQYQPPQHHHHQQRYNKFNSSPTQHHQHNRPQRGGYQRDQHYSPNQRVAASTSSGATNGAEAEEDIALEYLRSVIQCLNQNPGQFDTVATRFLNIYDGMETNQHVLCNAMEDIFKESIQNPNFRYMGAKLYNLLHMLDLKKDSLFMNLLKCKLDFHQQEMQEYMQQNQPEKVRETALFLAELYMQLRGDDSRILLLAENIVYSLQQLLLSESIDNLRCICLTLKLAGYDLTNDCPVEMREIIPKLEAINERSPGKYPMVANVITLQKNNWGRKVSNSSSMSEADFVRPAEVLRTSDEPIFYGPDGRELTAEENDFLAGGAAGLGGSTDEEDGASLDLDLDPEMDEESARAYKEFCGLNATI